MGKKTSLRKSNDAAEGYSQMMTNLLDSRIAQPLNGAFRQPKVILNKQAGVISECSFCDSPGGSCLRRPGYLCRRVYKAGTLLDEYETALRQLQQHTFGLCMSRGGPIKREILRNQPEASVCTLCRV